MVQVVLLGPWFLYFQVILVNPLLRYDLLVLGILSPQLGRWDHVYLLLRCAQLGPSSQWHQLVHVDRLVQILQ